MKKQEVIVIGAGLAGLSCALGLVNAGIDVIVLEASDAVGGRVKTDKVDGFILDRGFQVYLDSYPNAGSLLDHEALELCAFEPGARLYGRGGGVEVVEDVFRKPGAILKALRSKIGTVKDKLLVAKLRVEVQGMEREKMASYRGVSTVSFLRDYGFSERMIDSFFRPFYGGVFLERALETGAESFLYTFKMFSIGRACVPKRGMEEIPQQLASRLPSGVIQFQTQVLEVRDKHVVLEGGEVVKAQKVVVATDMHTADRLLGVKGERRSKSVIGMYFESSQLPEEGAVLCLNQDPSGIVNNLSVLSEVSRAYAPEGKHLISISILTDHVLDGLEQRVTQELEAWFGEEVREWNHLRTYDIRMALPYLEGEGERAYDEEGGVIRCGDYFKSASIDGSIESGVSAAEALIGMREQ
ncbi:NAD(P)/FAD-dependent oxidoreductase [Rubritalea tangerina]|uniref:NAD(P)/FAD-dependent oxidoreductase n=1 Tax=Rubritalea tangerina TaxID=430798 RepID=A0ABW4ZDL3_9BACT